MANQLEAQANDDNNNNNSFDHIVNGILGRFGEPMDTTDVFEILFFLSTFSEISGRLFSSPKNDKKDYIKWFNFNCIIELSIDKFGKK